MKRIDPIWKRAYAALLRSAADSFRSELMPESEPRREPPKGLITPERTEEERASERGYNIEFSAGDKWADRVDIKRKVTEFLDNDVARALARQFDGEVSDAHDRLRQVTWMIMPAVLLMDQYGGMAASGEDLVAMPAEQFRNDGATPSWRKRVIYHEVLGHIIDYMVDMEDNKPTVNLSSEEWEVPKEMSAEIQALKGMIEELPPDATEKDVMDRAKLFQIRHKWTDEETREMVELAMDMEQTKLMNVPCDQDPDECDCPNHPEKVSGRITLIVRQSSKKLDNDFVTRILEIVKMNDRGAAAVSLAALLEEYGVDFEDFRSGSERLIDIPEEFQVKPSKNLEFLSTE